MTDEPVASVELSEASSVVVLAPNVRDAAISAGVSLLEAVDSRFDHVVPVTVGHAPDQWLVEWERQTGGADRRITRVDVEGLTRSAAAAPRSDGDPPVRTRQVSDATDLIDLGMTITDAVEDAAAAGDRAAICVHSLSDLLQHADRQRVFNFVVTLSDRVRRHDAVVYFYLDSDWADRETVDTFAAPCDAVVDLDGDVYES